MYKSHIKAIGIYLSVSFLILLSSSFACSSTSIRDISHLARGKVRKIYKPKSVVELQRTIMNARHPIAIAGGRFSQGGHVWNYRGIVLDMTKLNRIISLDRKDKKITVEAGATWAQIQKYIDPHGLSIKVMQSYNDFTVGGSLSVNVHGRTIQNGALIETVESIKLVLADGSLVTASREENYKLFRASIGGYGAVGAIVEVTLSLTDNIIIEKKEVVMPIDQYNDYFETMIKNNPNVVFHNANLYTDNFNRVSSITWYKTDKLATCKDRFQKKQPFSFEYIGFQAARYIRGLQKVRLPMQMAKNSKTICWRNYEMSSSVLQVQPMSRVISTTVLQEYFVPCDKVEIFIRQLKEIVKRHNVNMLNVSLRYIHKDTESIMAYAQPEESFALVCYINMANNRIGKKKAQRWTQELIDCVLKVGGTYYLPYQLHATTEQFRKAYPRNKELTEIKKVVDPSNRFMNSFLQKYIVA